MERKKMVIIGATGSAYKRTIPALKDSEICVVSAIQSRNEEKLRKICDEFGIKSYYTNISKMLKDETYDLIYIANPPFLHKETIEQCVQYGKPIICEKPLARNYEEAKQIKDILNDKNIPFMVAHHLRHQKAYEDLQYILENKEIGEIVSCWGQWGFAINPHKDSSSWKLNRLQSGGGTLTDNGIHVLDLMLGLFKMPKKVLGSFHLNGFSETYGNETMLMIYDDKDIVIQSSHTMPFAGNHLLIYGTKGSIEVDGAFGESSIKKMIIKSSLGEYVKEYEPENLYKKEIENFIQYQSNHKYNYGTTLDEAIDALRLIDEMRNGGK